MGHLIFRLLKVKQLEEKGKKGNQKLSSLSSTVWPKGVGVCICRKIGSEGTVLQNTFNRSSQNFLIVVSLLSFIVLLPTTHRFTYTQQTQKCSKFFVIPSIFCKLVDQTFCQGGGKVNVWMERFASGLVEKSKQRLWY